MVDKTRFTSRFDHEAAERAELYAIAEPVDPELAGGCLSDRVGQVGEMTSFSTGVCAVASECTFRNDKSGGISGHCLKAEVGIRQDEV